MYLIIQTRPDLSLVESMIETQVATHCHVYMLPAKKVLRYLCGIRNSMLILNPIQGKELMAFVDAS